MQQVHSYAICLFDSLSLAKCFLSSLLNKIVMNGTTKANFLISLLLQFVLSQCGVEQGAIDRENFAFLRALMLQYY
jgi:hypothetical protein